MSVPVLPHKVTPHSNVLLRLAIEAQGPGIIAVDDLRCLRPIASDRLKIV